MPILGDAQNITTIIKRQYYYSTRMLYRLMRKGLPVGILYDFSHPPKPPAIELFGLKHLVFDLFPHAGTLDTLILTIRCTIPKKVIKTVGIW